MKKIYRPDNIFLGAALSLAILVAGAATGAQTKTIKEVPAHMTASLEGKDLYTQFCAVCHGVDAKGGGPAADALKRRPSDLTLLSRMNGGKFPTISVQMTIKGSATLEHGTREMPIWGNVFSEMGRNHDMGDLRVMSVLKYIEQIQAK